MNPILGLPPRMKALIAGQAAIGPHPDQLKRHIAPAVMRTAQRVPVETPRTLQHLPCHGNSIPWVFLQIHGSRRDPIGYERTSLVRARRTPVRQKFTGSPSSGTRSIAPSTVFGSRSRSEPAQRNLSFSRQKKGRNPSQVRRSQSPVMLNDRALVGPPGTLTISLPPGPRNRATVTFVTLTFLRNLARPRLPAEPS
jgi:hypothetical protein